MTLNWLYLILPACILAMQARILFMTRRMTRIQRRANTLTAEVLAGMTNTLSLVVARIEKLESERDK